MEVAHPLNSKPAHLPVIVGALLTTAFALQILLLNSFTGASIYLLSSEAFLLVGAGTLLWALIHRRSLLDDPIYLAVFSYVIFIGIGPLVGSLGGVPLAVTASPESTACSWFAFAALVCGCWSARLTRSRRGTQQAPASLAREFRWGTMKRAGIVYTLVGLVAIAVYLQTVGWCDYLLYASYATRGSVSGYYTTPLGLLRPGFFLLLAWATARKKVPLGWTVALAAYCVLDLLWFGPIRGSRHHIITFVLTALYLTKQSIAWRARPRFRAIPATWVVALGLTLVFVWGGLRVYTLSQIREDQGRRDTYGDVQGAAFSSLYSPYDTYARIVDATPNFVPFLMGSSISESLTVLVPRDLWPSKPEPLGDWLSITFYGVQPWVANTVPTWPGECYLNFGLAGLLAGMFAMGALCAWLALWSKAASGGCGISPPRILLYGVTFPLIFDMMHEGSNGAVWFLFTNTLPVCAAIWLARRHSAHTRANVASRVEGEKRIAEFARI